LIARQAEAATDEVLAEGHVSDESWNAIERLSTLQQIRASQSYQRPSRARLIALIAVVLAGVSALLFCPVWTTDVELDVRVSAIEVTLAAARVGIPQPFTGAIRGLTAVEMTGVRRLQLLSEGTPNARSYRASEGEAWPVRLSSIPSVSHLTGGCVPETTGQPMKRGVRKAARPSMAPRASTIAVTPISVPTGTAVGVSLMGERKRLTLSFGIPPGSDLSIALSIDGAICVISPLLGGQSGAPPGVRLALASPDVIEFQTGSEQAELTLTYSEEPAFDAWPNIPVSAVDFSAYREDLERTIPRSMSTIVSGNLYLDSLQGKAVALRPGEPLHVTKLEGELRVLRLDAGKVVANLHGTVADLSVGPRDRPRTLKPSLLEWLRARQGLLLFWGTCVSLLTLALTVLRWSGFSL
jgi:hypothetical protein